MSSQRLMLRSSAEARLPLTKAEARGCLKMLNHSCLSTLASSTHIRRWNVSSQTAGDLAGLMSRKMGAVTLVPLRKRTPSGHACCSMARAQRYATRGVVW